MVLIYVVLIQRLLVNVVLQHNMICRSICQKLDDAIQYVRQVEQYDDKKAGRYFFIVLSSRITRDREMASS